MNVMHLKNIFKTYICFDYERCHCSPIHDEFSRSKQEKLCAEKRKILYMKIIKVKRELAKKWLYDIATNHTVVKVNFNRIIFLRGIHASKLIWSTGYFEMTERRLLLKEDLVPPLIVSIEKNLGARY